MKTKTKLLVCALIFFAGGVINLFFSTALHGLLTAERTTPWYGQLMTIPQTIAYMLQVNYWLEKYRVEIV